MNQKIDRMLIDDAGSNPIKLAKVITRQLENKFSPVNVRKICEDIDIVDIIEEEMSDFEGMLQTDEHKSSGRIILNSKRNHSRKRYTIAHEIGHYVNPTHYPIIPNQFQCTEKDFRIDHNNTSTRHFKMEAEANQFAAELLMPSEWLSNYSKSNLIPDIKHIIEISDRFKVSKEASGRRFVEVASPPLAIIFSRNGKIRYFKKNQNFNWLAVSNNQKIPKESITAKFTGNVGEISDIETVDAHIWLKKSPNITLGEQTIVQTDGFRMTLLSVDDVEIESDTYWEPPKFR